MITVTPATELDADDLLSWRNDPAARAASGATEPVSPAQHAAWLRGVLSDDRRFLYVACDTESVEASAKVGMCRFDIGTDERAEVSINLNPECRGKGFARPVLRAGIVAFRSQVGNRIGLTATIRPSNVASAKVFGAVGFELASSDDEFDHYVLFEPVA